MRGEAYGRGWPMTANTQPQNRPIPRGVPVPLRCVTRTVTSTRHLARPLLSPAQSPALPSTHRQPLQHVVGLLKCALLLQLRPHQRHAVLQRLGGGVEGHVDAQLGVGGLAHHVLVDDAQGGNQVAHEARLTAAVPAWKQGKALWRGLGVRGEGESAGAPLQLYTYRMHITHIQSHTATHTQSHTHTTRPTRCPLLYHTHLHSSCVPSSVFWNT